MTTPLDTPPPARAEPGADKTAAASAGQRPPAAQATPAAATNTGADAAQPLGGLGAPHAAATPETPPAPDAFATPAVRQLLAGAAVLALVAMVAATVAAAWMNLQSPSPSLVPLPPRPPPALASRPALPAQRLPSPGEASTATPALQPANPAPLAQAPAPPGSCASGPAVAAASPADGKFPLQTDVSGLMAADITSFVLLGNDAAAANRPRDAEAAFLMACRLAEELGNAKTIASGEARYQLGSLYARTALATPGQANTALDANRAELLARAERLLSDSLQAYAYSQLEPHDHVIPATEALASVKKTLAQAKPAPPAGSHAPHNPVAVAPPPQPALHAKANASAMPSPPLSGPAPAAPLSPPSLPLSPSGHYPTSFNCAHARSVPEKMICADAELARLDRNLGRLYARAKAMTPNRAAFRRQQNQEWLRRESTCHDRRCLLGWYAQRRSQLQQEIDQATSSENWRRNKSPTDLPDIYRGS